MRPEGAAEFHQRVVARHELAPEAAEGTRQSFEQLREIFRYGVLWYDIFTMIADHALLVFEQALRDRFNDFRKGKVILAEVRSGYRQERAADRYEQAHDFVRSHKKWELLVGGGPGSS